MVPSSLQFEIGDRRSVAVEIALEIAAPLDVLIAMERESNSAKLELSPFAAARRS